MLTVLENQCQAEFSRESRAHRSSWPPDSWAQLARGRLWGGAMVGSRGAVAKKRACFALLCFAECIWGSAFTNSQQFIRAVMGLHLLTCPECFLQAGQPALPPSCHSPWPVAHWELYSFFLILWLAFLYSPPDFNVSLEQQLHLNHLWSLNWAGLSAQYVFVEWRN